jgi:hypothetical protein
MQNKLEYSGTCLAGGTYYKFRYGTLEIRFVTPIVFTTANNVQSAVLHLVISGNRGQVSLA